MPVIRDLAKEFLRPYVERGDSPEQICNEHPATGDDQNCLQVGGQARMNGSVRPVGGGQVAVTRYAGQDSFTTFSVAELYREIHQEREERDRPKQQHLW